MVYKYASILYKNVYSMYLYIRTIDKSTNPSIPEGFKAFKKMSEILI